MKTYIVVLVCTNCGKVIEKKVGAIFSGHCYDDPWENDFPLEIREIKQA